ncbi:hypothetical protein VTO42DRAFT_951 [Malbranchea cinnamomea]
MSSRHEAQHLPAAFGHSATRLQRHADTPDDDDCVQSVTTITWQASSMQGRMPVSSYEAVDLNAGNFHRNLGIKDKSLEKSPKDPFSLGCGYFRRSGSVMLAQRLRYLILLGSQPTADCDRHASMDILEVFQSHLAPLTGRSHRRFFCYFIIIVFTVLSLFA